MMFLLLINPQKQSQNHRENVPGVLFRRIPPKKQDDVKHPERKENKKGKMLSRTENKKKTFCDEGNDEYKEEMNKGKK